MPRREYPQVRNTGVEAYQEEQSPVLAWHCGVRMACGMAMHVGAMVALTEGCSRLWSRIGHDIQLQLARELENVLSKMVLPDSSRVSGLQGDQEASPGWQWSGALGIIICVLLGPVRQVLIQCQRLLENSTGVVLRVCRGRDS